MVDKSTSKSSQYKFSSHLLSYPFASAGEHEVKGQEIHEDIPIEDNKGEGQGMELSTSSIHKMEASSSKNSITSSINFTKKELITQFNGQNDQQADSNGANPLMNQTSSSINQSSGQRKRKPFDKLSFHSDSVTQISEKQLQQQQITPSISQQVNKPAINESSQSILEEKSVLNLSISFQEKSFIMTSYKTLSKETLEKAKLFNSQYKSSTPFWIQFFESIGSGTLQSNSSYYKTSDKNQYVKSLIEMVQKDAELYDKIMKNNATKEQTQKAIKEFIQEDNSTTNISLTKEKAKDKPKDKDKDKAKDKEKNKVKDDESSLNDSNTKANELDKSQQEINYKLVKVLCAYDKIDEKDRKYYNNEANYDAFKFNLITGGKFTNTTTALTSQLKPEENINEIQNQMAHIDEEDENPSEAKETLTGKAFKTIDSLYFGPDYTFEELNYDKIDFCCYDKGSLKRLLELDCKLNQLNPQRYTTSINTELKKIQDDFNESKAERQAKDEREAKALYDKAMSKNKEKKKTIFDIEEKSEEKIQYKDYLREMQASNASKSKLDSKLKQLDAKLKLINTEPVEDNRKEEIANQLDEYHSTEEYKQVFSAMVLPGYVQLKRVRGEIEEFDRKNQAVMVDLDKMRQIIEEEKKKSPAEEDKAYVDEVVKPFYQFQEQLEREDKNNKGLAEKIRKMEEDNAAEEDNLRRLNEKLEKMKNERERFDKMFDDADEVMNEAKGEGEENGGDGGNQLKDYLKLYGIDEIAKDDDSEEEKLKEDMNNVYEMFLKAKEEDEKDEVNRMKRLQYYDSLKASSALNTVIKTPPTSEDTSCGQPNNQPNELKDTLSNKELILQDSLDMSNN